MLLNFAFKKPIYEEAGKKIRSEMKQMFETRANLIVSNETIGELRNLTKQILEQV